jgi:hypothetical protein
MVDLIGMCDHIDGSPYMRGGVKMGVQYMGDINKMVGLVDG